MTNNEKCEQVRKALPSGGITRIMEDTGYSYDVVYRTMNGNVRKWKPKHTEILKSGRKLLRKSGVKLV